MVNRPELTPTRTRCRRCLGKKENPPLLPIFLFRYLKLIFLFRYLNGVAHSL